MASVPSDAEGVSLRVVLNVHNLDDDTAEELEKLHTFGEEKRLIEALAKLFVIGEVDVHDVQVWDA